MTEYKRLDPPGAGAGYAGDDYDDEFNRSAGSPLTPYSDYDPDTGVIYNQVEPPGLGYQPAGGVNKDRTKWDKPPGAGLWAGSDKDNEFDRGAGDPKTEYSDYEAD